MPRWLFYPSVNAVVVIHPWTPGSVFFVKIPAREVSGKRSSVQPAATFRATCTTNTALPFGCYLREKLITSNAFPVICAARSEQLKPSRELIRLRVEQAGRRPVVGLGVSSNKAVAQANGSQQSPAGLLHASGLAPYTGPPLHFTLEAGEANGPLQVLAPLCVATRA